MFDPYAADFDVRIPIASVEEVDNRLRNLLHRYFIGSFSLSSRMLMVLKMFYVMNHG